MRREVPPETSAVLNGFKETELGPIPVDSNAETPRSRDAEAEDLSAPLRLGDSAFEETEIGPIPVEWEVVRLGEIATLSLGRTPPRKEEKYWTNGTVPWVAIKDLNNGIITDTAERISLCAFDELMRNKIVTAGTLLLSFKLTIGKVGILGIDAVHNEAIASILPDERVVLRDYLFFTLQIVDYDAFLDTYVKGKTLNKRKLNILPIPLPPLPEQRRIAHVLSTIQRAIAAQDALIAAAREVKRSLMQRLFTYGTQRRGDAETQSVRTKMTEIGEIPEHWAVVRLGELIHSRRLMVRNGFPCGDHNQQGRGIPHLRPFNVTTEGQIELETIKYVETSKDVKLYLLKPGDIIFNNTNSEELVGKTAYWDRVGDFVLSNHMTILRVLDLEVLDPFYLSRFLHKRWYDGYYRSICRRHVNQASISLARLSDIPVPLPPLSEQRRIADMLSAVDRKIEAEERRKAALQALFKAMLHQLMTDQIRLTQSRRDAEAQRKL